MHQRPKPFQLFFLSILAALTFSALTSTKTIVSHTAASTIQQERGQEKKIGVRLQNLRIHREGNHPVDILEINNLDDENFLETLEIKIKNVSQKPIYFARIQLRFPDVTGPPGMGSLGISLIYGRSSMIYLPNLAQPEDVPLQPGETYILKIPEKMRKNTEEFFSNYKIPKSALENLELRVLETSFGDGTGYRSGQYYPFKKTSNERPPNRRSPVFSSFFLRPGK